MLRSRSHTGRRKWPRQRVRHPENGRKALFLNPVRMESIVGMEDKEALALIDELMRHATQKKYEYRHKWRHGDWVMWDNRSVMHPG
jgi:taurine dioxygenase